MTAVSVQEKPQTAGQTILKDEERTRCEVWTRVMGYHRPVSAFNVGKKSEFAERKFFNEPCCK
ncbi:Anaerobic ribonucleoside-triphosphate reductase [Formivibrio citricus]|uniref:Anaerobic ribonucleoside-triphosphate reductase n=1 Tax=Formivibrio citricus TaxID=83765 RepID=A0A1I5CGD9_9NEIS|nr:anaerobic ribonucleoside-triphosphate reductase [Formivibrio citricus]SFN85993.1 Anaerobic ribonucleoside-triphosphate reductase [Formivibrio citricus]